MKLFLSFIAFAAGLYFAVTYWNYGHFFPPAEASPSSTSALEQ